MSGGIEHDASTTVEPRDVIARVMLDAAERAAVAEVIDEVAPRTGRPDPPIDEQLERICVLAHRLPERLRTVLTRFRITGKPYGGLLLSGLPIDESLVGATPTSYNEVVDRPEVHRAGAALVLFGALLGHPFSFLSQQQGRLLLDVFPVAEHHQTQLGSSSTVELEWHNEDAFHEFRADWIMLLCLRNPERVPTTYVGVHDIDLDPTTRALLFAERFVILPDESHTAAFNLSTTGVAEDGRQPMAFDHIAELNRGERRISVLSGDPRAPMIRIDPAFMVRALGDEPAQRALDEVIDAVSRRMADVVLDPGDLLIIDNKRAVHGRRPFTARHDGTDRWLRRANLLADLRRVEARSGGSHGRAII